MREYHWMITYIVPTAGGFDFRQKSGLCQPGSRTRRGMFEALAQRVMDGDGLTVADFSVVFFGLEPNDLDASPTDERRSVGGEHYEALRRDVAEMVVSLRQLIARPKMDLGMQISLPEDFDAEKVKQEFRFMLGLCRECGKSPCVCLRSAPCPDWSHEIEHDAHEWDAPVDGHVHCPGWPTVADSDEQNRDGGDEPEPIGYTVVTVFSNGVAFIPADTENQETRDEAVARQKHLTERIPPHDGSWVACKVVPLVDEQGQG